MNWGRTQIIVLGTSLCIIIVALSICLSLLYKHNQSIKNELYLTKVVNDELLADNKALRDSIKAISRPVHEQVRANDRAAITKSNGSDNNMITNQSDGLSKGSEDHHQEIKLKRDRIVERVDSVYNYVLSSSNKSSRKRDMINSLLPMIQNDTLWMNSETLRKYRFVKQYIRQLDYEDLVREEARNAAPRFGLG